MNWSVFLMTHDFLVNVRNLENIERFTMSSKYYAPACRLALLTNRMKG